MNTEQSYLFILAMLPAISLISMHLSRYQRKFNKFFYFLSKNIYICFLILSNDLQFIDYVHETSRASADLVLHGKKRKYSDIKFILSHGGGTLPTIATRIAGGAGLAIATHLLWTKYLMTSRYSEVTTLKLQQKQASW